MTNQDLGIIHTNLATEFNNGRCSVKPVVSVALALWFVITFLLGTQGAFVGRPGSPPLPIFLGFTIPLGLFFAAHPGLYGAPVYDVALHRPFPGATSLAAAKEVKRCIAEKCTRVRAKTRRHLEEPDGIFSTGMRASRLVS